MTQGKQVIRGWKLLAAIAAVALPLGTARAQSYDYSRYSDPDAGSASVVNGLDQDRNDLISARHRADDLAAQRDQVQQQVDAARNGQVAASVTPSGDVQGLQQAFDAAKAKADKIHADAVTRFEQSDEWKSQFAQFDQARKDLKGPTDALLNQLGQTKDFQALVADARTAKERVDKLHEDKNADPKAVKDAEAAFTAADNRVQDAAEKALSADSKVREGRKLVDASKAKLDGLRDRFEQDLIKDATFGAAVADVKAKREALDAANGQPSSEVASALPSGSLDEAQRKLDQLNRDLDQARQDVDRLTDRVRQDESATASAPQQEQAPAPYDSEVETGSTAYAPPDVGYNPAPTYGAYDPAAAYGYGYGYDQPYGVPVYSPVVAYDAYDYWSPGLSFGLSFGSYGFNHHHYDDWYGRWVRPYSYGSYGGYYGYGYGSHGRSYGGSYGRGTYGGRDYSRGSYVGRGYTGSSYSSRGSSRGYYEGSRYGSGSTASRFDAGRSTYSGRASSSAGGDVSAYRQRVQARQTYGYSATPSFEGTSSRYNGSSTSSRYSGSTYSGRSSGSSTSGRYSGSTYTGRSSGSSSSSRYYSPSSAFGRTDTGRSYAGGSSSYSSRGSSRSATPSYYSSARQATASYGYSGRSSGSSSGRDYSGSSSSSHSSSRGSDGGSSWSHGGSDSRSSSGSSGGSSHGGHSR